LLHIWHPEREKPLCYVCMYVYMYVCMYVSLAISVNQALLILSKVHYNRECLNKQIFYTNLPELLILVINNKNMVINNQSGSSVHSYHT